jgi:HPt (histidine-containing phosphotransfer) domain-containing protein
MRNEYQYIDMRYLNEVSSNKEFQKKIFDLFRLEVATYEIKMIKALEEKSYIELADLAHKAKSSVSVLGMKNQAEAMKKLQTDITHNINSDSYVLRINQFLQDCHKALQEINETENNV